MSLQVHLTSRWHNHFRSFKNRVMIGLIWTCTILAITPLVFVFYYVLQRGLPALNMEFFTSLPAPVGQDGGGIANALLGSFIMVAGASALAVPIGILSGIYLSEYGTGKIANLLRFTIDLLTSVPSIVIGLFIYALVVIKTGGFSGYAGAAALAIIMLPIVSRSSEEVLKLMPRHVREAGLALGISRWRVTIFIVLRGSMRAVATGVLLAIARVSGETAPLLFTAFNNQFWPSGLNQPMPSLPVQIYNYAISPFEQWHNQAWAGALVLVMLVFAFNLFTRLLMSRGSQG